MRSPSGPARCRPSSAWPVAADRRGVDRGIAQVAPPARLPVSAFSVRAAVYRIRFLGVDDLISTQIGKGE